MVDELLSLGFQRTGPRVFSYGVPIHQVYPIAYDDGTCGIAWRIFGILAGGENGLDILDVKQIIEFLERD